MIASAAFLFLAMVLPILSWEAFADTEANQIGGVIGAIVIMEIVLVVIPWALLWQWYDLATGGPLVASSDSERRYYSATVFLFAAVLVGIWYAIPCRSIVRAAHEGFIPILKSPGEAQGFVDSAELWLKDESNWAWLAFPITLLAWAYARLVVRTPPFVRSRGGQAQSALEAAGRGVSYALYRLSQRIQALVDQTIEAVRRLALTLNRALAEFIDRAITLVLNLADVTFRLTAVASFVVIALVFLIPGIAMGNPLLILVGIVLLLGIALAIATAFTRAPE